MDEGLQGGNLIASDGLLMFITKHAGKALFDQMFTNNPNFILNIYQLTCYAYAAKITSFKNGYL